MTVSGLSQRVVCGETPYSIEIFKADAAPGWRVDAVDTLREETVWSGSAKDDALAFLEAMRQIHALEIAASLRQSIGR